MSGGGGNASTFHSGNQMFVGRKPTLENTTKYLSWEVPPEQKFGTLTSFLKLQVAMLLPG